MGCMYWCFYCSQELHCEMWTLFCSCSLVLHYETCVEGAVSGCPDEQSSIATKALKDVIQQANFSCSNPCRYISNMCLSLFYSVNYLRNEIVPFNYEYHTLLTVDCEKLEDSTKSRLIDFFHLYIRHITYECAWSFVTSMNFWFKIINFDCILFYTRYMDKY